MRKKTLQIVNMAIKIDLEKAYDRLSWTFINDTLEEVGLSHVWIQNIMHSIESSRFVLLRNGKK